MNRQSSERVPRASKPTYEQITGMTSVFCEQHLNGDYAALCTKMAATLARKRPAR